MKNQPKIVKISIQESFFSLNCFDSLLKTRPVALSLVLDLCPVVVYRICGIMQQGRYFARIRNSQLDQGEYSQLRSKSIVSFGRYGFPLRQQGIELVDKIRIQVQESGVEHFIELRYVFIYRRQGLYLRNDIGSIAAADIFQDMVLVLSGGVDVFREYAQEQCDILLFDLVRLQYLGIQVGKLSVGFDKVLVPVLDLVLSRTLCLM